MPTYPSISVTAPSTALPFPYAHCTDYFAKGIDASGPFYNVRYYVTGWANSDDFVNALQGYTSYSGAFGTGVVTKRSPHQHPLSPNLFCRSAKVVPASSPVQNANGFPLYDNGFTVECEYRPMTTSPVEMTPAEQNLGIDNGTPIVFCTQEVDLTTEMYTIPNTSMVYTSGASIGKILVAPFRIQIPVGHLQLTFHKLAYNPWSLQCRALRGKINNAPFLGAAAQCVLFKSAKIIRDWDTSGDSVMKLMLTFAEKPADMHWNQVPDPSDPSFRGAAVVGYPGLGDPYQQGDFSSMIIF